MAQFIYTYVQTGFEKKPRFEKGNYLIDINDIKSIDNDLIVDCDGDKYVRIYCKHGCASHSMFIFMAILAVLIIGIPWFIAYCLGVKVKLTKYIVKLKDVESLLSEKENINPNSFK